MADRHGIYPEVPGQTYTVDVTRWDKNLAYGFNILKVDPKTQKYTQAEGFKTFDLPINPSNISISVPFAINTLATTRGVLEEHNGVVFRHIVLSGTTGVAPLNKRKGGYEKTGGADSGFWGSVVAGASNVLSGVQNVLNNLSDTLVSAGRDYKKLTSAISTSDLEELGYAKLHRLLNYFVSYADYKKHSKYSNHRLVFYNKKDNVSYVVSPISFDIVKSADSPHIYNYKITLKAWAINEGGLDPVLRNQYDFSVADNNVLSAMMNTLRGARSVISSSADTVRAVSRDVDAVIGIGNEAMLVVKDAGGFSLTCAEFPELMANQWNRISRGFEQKAREIKNAFTGGGDAGDQPHSDRIATATLKSVDLLSGTARDRATSTPRDASGPAVDSTNPFSTAQGTNANIDLLDQYGLEDMNFSSADEEGIDDKTAKARALTINDWDVRRAKIEAVRDAYADSRGLSDESYNAAARRSSVTGTRRVAVSEDFVILNAFNDMIAVIDGLSATNDLIKLRLPDPFARAREIVGESGITIGSPAAAFAVPFPFGGSLEGLATSYLGSPDRWLEIAILNDLKSPFVDEDGFILSFTTSGNGNSFTVASKTNLHPNQEVFLSSSSQREERRRIVKIDKLGVANFLITVDGDDDLDRFTANQQAKMKAFIPNTINSGRVILIPTEPREIAASAEDLPDTRDIPATMNLNQQERLMGVDIGLTDNFDLAVKNSGDVVIATGLANAMQAIKLKLATEKGQLRRHQEYGAGLPIGEKLELSAADLKLIIEQAIMSDPRFVDVPNIQVQFNGPAVRLNIAVTVANDGGTIPVSFTL